jgi:hypothetical protein
MFHYSPYSEPQDECWLLPCAELFNGRMYLFLLMLAADNSQVSGLKCQIWMKSNGHETKWLVPVYPVGATRKRVREDGQCASIDKKDFKKFLTKENDGDTSQRVFEIWFQLVEQ